VNPSCRFPVLLFVSSSFFPFDSHQLIHTYHLLGGGPPPFDIHRHAICPLSLGKLLELTHPLTQPLTPLFTVVRSGFDPPPPPIRPGPTAYLSWSCIYLGDSPGLEVDISAPRLQLCSQSNTHPELLPYISHQRTLFTQPPKALLLYPQPLRPFAIEATQRGLFPQPTWTSRITSELFAPASRPFSGTTAERKSGPSSFRLRSTFDTKQPCFLE
jgi:hypothetical protein